ncbi:MAG: HEAT repeat domain-containing protein, partial [Planctomycetota bacterium]|nr:HEAT repeat domain-containing protein [Planctomycetota bacterium]
MKRALPFVGIFCAVTCLVRAFDLPGGMEIPADPGKARAFFREKLRRIARREMDIGDAEEILKALRMSSLADDREWIQPLKAVAAAYPEEKSERVVENALYHLYALGVGRDWLWSNITENKSNRNLAYYSILVLACDMTWDEYFRLKDFLDTTRAGDRPAGLEKAAGEAEYSMRLLEYADWPGVPVEDRISHLAKLMRPTRNDPSLQEWQKIAVPPSAHWSRKGLRRLSSKRPIDAARVLHERRWLTPLTTMTISADEILNFASDLLSKEARRELARLRGEERALLDRVTALVRRVESGGAAEAEGAAAELERLGGAAERFLRDYIAREVDSPARFRLRAVLDRMGNDRGVRGRNPGPRIAGDAASRHPSPRPTPHLVRIVPRTSYAEDAFRQLDRLGGTEVVMPWRPFPALLVPVELRFVPVEGRRLVDAVAASRGLRADWAEEGKFAILHEGADEVELERVRNDLGSADPSMRRDATWRAGWLKDIRIVHLLVTAAADADAETARLARIALKRANLDAALMPDKRAADAFVRSSERRSVGYGAIFALSRAGRDRVLEFIGDAPDRLRGSAVFVLGRIGGEEALRLIEKALAGRNGYVRQDAVAALGRIGGEKALTLLEKALGDGDLSVRRDAVSALGRIGGGRALALIERATADKDSEVRMAAILALDGSEEDIAVALAEDAVRSNDEEMRHSAVRVLGSMKSAMAPAVIEKLLFDARENARLRYEAALALGRTGSGNAPELLEKAMADGNCTVRCGAVLALGNVGGDKALALLERALADGDADVRGCAALALGNVGGDKALSLLEKALADGDVAVRSAAAVSLGKVDCERAPAILERTIFDQGQDDIVRCRAISALNCISEDKAFALIERALADRSARVLHEAARMLDFIGSVKALPLVEKAISHQNAAVRLKAVSALGRIGGEKALILLEKALSDPNAVVRSKVVSALGEVGSGKAVAPLGKAMSDKDADVRRDAVLAAGRVESGEALALIGKAMDDNDAAVRRQAVSSAESVGGRQALALLERALADRDAEVRKDAAGAIGRIGGTRARDLLLN